MAEFFSRPYLNITSYPYDNTRRNITFLYNEGVNKAFVGWDDDGLNIYASSFWQNERSCIQNERPCKPAERSCCLNESASDQIERPSGLAEHPVNPDERASDQDERPSGLADSPSIRMNVRPTKMNVRPTRTNVRPVRKNWLNLQKQLQIEWLNMLEKLTNFQFYKKQFPRKSTI